MLKSLKSFLPTAIIVTAVMVVLYPMIGNVIH
ncbi:MAG: hypothetical protein [Caudoviricetes sp.]|nr:MAG: hypothetical protein [Caudoviricetes sp.]